MSTFDQQHQQTQQQTNIAGDAHSGDSIAAGNISDSEGVVVAHDAKVTMNITNIHRRASGADETTADPLQAALDLLATMPTEGEIPPVTTLPTGSRIVYPPNPHFVGREEELCTAAHHLKGGGDVAVHEMQPGHVAATGMGGIGKTQLAAAFAHRYGRYFAGGVHWVSMADAASVAAEVVACGLEMAGVHVAGADGISAHFAQLDFQIQVQQVRRAWQQATPRLLIFDNCEDPALLQEWRPRTGGCRVLVTSRRPQWGGTLGVQTLALTTLTRAQSVELLLKFRPDLSEQTRSRAFGKSSTSNPLDAIAEELGDLPLALHLAGSYLYTYRHEITPDDYLAELRTRPLHHESLLVDANDADNVLPDGYSPTEHDLHVGRTFDLSWQRLDPESKVDNLARRLLARAAFFAPNEPIPRTLLLATINDDTLTAIQKSRALQRLVALGLLDEGSQEDDGALLMHRLVIHFVQTVRADETARDEVEVAVYNEASTINRSGFFGPLLMWQPHLRHITDRAIVRKDEQSATLCHQLGYHLQVMGNNEGAQPYYEQALAIRLEVLGEMHPHTATSLNNLGALLDSRGDYEGAQSYSEQALAIRLKALGEMHPDTAHSLNNLGALLDSMGDYKEAKPYYEQALAIHLEVLGEMHPDTATSLNNLGALLNSMGDYEEAQTYYKQALSIRLEVLGEMHPDTAQSLNNLGFLFQSMGDYEGAQLYYEQALAIHEEVLGETHPNTALSLNNLGSLHQSMGDYKEAQAYYEQALAIRHDVLGDSHPHTARSLNNLGGLHSSMGDNKIAIGYIERALSILQSVLGDNHPDTSYSLLWLGALSYAQGAYEDALSYVQKALTIRATILGDDHPETKKARSLLNMVKAAIDDGVDEHECCRPSGR
ncbi:MAG: tetratricopeptide repeat protein [Chloroflexota bacterium]